MKQEEYDCYSLLVLSTCLFNAGCHTTLLFHTESTLSLGRYRLLNVLTEPLAFWGTIFIETMDTLCIVRILYFADNFLKISK